MTDATLIACVMLVQASWWRILHSADAERRRFARWLAFGMGLALLTKGPAAAVLALLPILLHAGWRRHWPVVGALLRDFWVWLICLAVAVPWYWVAELKTPGFISYFVLGEHVMRFLQPGWQGDRYGFAHAQPFGIIWPYTMLAGLPAMLLLVRAPWLRFKQGTGALSAQYREVGGNELACYALCITLAPLLLFTAARNIIWTYALTALPGLAILAVCILPAASLAQIRSWGLAMVLLLVYGWVFFFKAPQVGAGHSDLPLIEAYQQACGSQDCRLVYPAKPAYSAYFYTGGRLYAGMSGSPGAPAFKVVARLDKSSLPPAALACNREQCLLRDEVVAKPGQ